MPDSEAETIVNTETAAALSYQSIIDAAKDIVMGFVERIPYCVAAIISTWLFTLLESYRSYLELPTSK